jgi:opacity protein-like surface antigen
MLKIPRSLALGSLLLAALSTASPARAADPDRKYYVTAIGGWATQGSQDLAYSAPGVSNTVRAPLDSGFLTGAALGRRLGEHWRIEGEFVYQSVDVPTLTLGAGRPGGDGNYASTSVAINGLYDLDLFGSDRARSYVGLGAVYLTEVDIDFEQGATETSFSGSKGGLQVLLGVRYELGARAFLDVGLRYLVARNIELDAEAPAVGRIRADYEPLAVTAAFGWKF